MFSRVLLKNGSRIVPAFIPVAQAKVGNVIQFQGEVGWVVIKREAIFTRRSLPGQLGRRDSRAVEGTT